MFIERRVNWNGEDMGNVKLLSLTGDIGEKKWGIAVSNVLISAHKECGSAQKARAVLIKTNQLFKMFLLMGLGPHVINLLPCDHREEVQ